MATMKCGQRLANRGKHTRRVICRRGLLLHGIWDLLIRSRAAIAQFERAKVGGNPAQMAEARTALERCHAEVKGSVAAKNEMTKMLGRTLKAS
jgi:hypothetical protein